MPYNRGQPWPVYARSLYDRMRDEVEQMVNVLLSTFIYALCTRVDAEGGLMEPFVKEIKHSSI